MKICFVGNNAKGKPISDGGRIKMRNIMSEYTKMGNYVSTIDLYNWHYRFLSIIFKLKNAILTFDYIIVMAGPKGSRVILKLIHKMSKRNKKAKVVFIPVGLGTIDVLVKKLDFVKLSNFINSINYYGIKDEKMLMCLSKIDLVVPENEVLCSLYRDFYSLGNVMLLRNFRYGSSLKNHKRADGTLKIVFMSRIVENKGVFDLIDVLNSLVKRGLNIKLDFYGEIQLKNSSLFLDKMNENITYKGVCNPNLSVSILSNYDLLCLPTKYYAEGTPGIVVESFFAGTPCLISKYCQVDSLIVHKQTGILYKFNDKDDLEEKILDIYFNKYDMDAISKNVLLESNKYSIESAKIVLKKIIGLE